MSCAEITTLTVRLLSENARRGRRVLQCRIANYTTTLVSSTLITESPYSDEYSFTTRVSITIANQQKARNRSCIHVMVKCRVNDHRRKHNDDLQS